MATEAGYSVIDSCIGFMIPKPPNLGGHQQNVTNYGWYSNYGYVIEFVYVGVQHRLMNALHYLELPLHTAPIRLYMNPCGRVHEVQKDDSQSDAGTLTGAAGHDYMPSTGHYA